MASPVSRAPNTLLWLGTVILSACAGSTQPGPATSAPPAPRVVADRAAAAPAATTSRAPVASTDDDDPEEADDPATLEPMVTHPDHVPFLKAKVKENDCWQMVSLTGEARQDYATLVEHCGKPTGSIEYAKPGEGALDYVRDKHDTFIVFLRGGLCYRFFGVGDSTIPKLNIVIERNGSLQGEGRADGSVAIINTDKAWCIDSDAEYRFLVQVGGKGHGRYVFGVWARRPT